MCLAFKIIFLTLSPTCHDYLWKSFAHQTDTREGFLIEMPSIRNGVLSRVQCLSSAALVVGGGGFVLWLVGREVRFWEISGWVNNNWVSRWIRWYWICMHNFRNAEMILTEILTLSSNETMY